MSRFYSYLNTATTLLASYQGQEPFAATLKKYFAQHKKYGSGDRKQIAHLCYCYFRMGRSMLSLPVSEKILAGLFLCSQAPDKMLAALMPEWNDKVQLSVSEKKNELPAPINEEDIFSWHQELSDVIDWPLFLYSHLTQPDLFIRVRPGSKRKLINQLSAAGISYTELAADCISMPNSSKLESIIQLNKDAVIQDYSSQQTGRFLQKIKPATSSPPLKVWDCCAASGGKSIMAKDILGKIELTVSDIRASILANLRKRFLAAGIHQYQSLVLDLACPVKDLPVQQADLVIADLPCTGSGTWGRTPEQLIFFQAEKIKEYSQLQKAILSNIIPALKPGGYLLYITCSVFKAENEDIVTLLQKDHQLNLLDSEVVKGYLIKADTMFGALLQKPL